MIYREFQDLQLSALGLGMMRLPVISGDDSKVDMEAASEMVDYAMEHGINYYDTAWAYHGGESEHVTGELLRKYPREQYYLASKFPGFDEANIRKVKEIFEKQLERCGTGYFDFYLLHNVCETNVDFYLEDDKYGVCRYLLEQKAAGRIRHLGFSSHGNLDVLERFLRAYGRDMEFCQLQINYVDWTFQNAKEKVELLTEYGIPVWVMEPVRGGRLASVPDSYLEKLRALRPEEKTAAAWAFRFVQSIPQVKVILSGMSDMAQLKENIATFQEEKPLDERERTVIEELVAQMLEQKTVPCTACRYCVSKCPQELDIPELLRLYNEHCLTVGGSDGKEALASYAEEKKPGACVGCRSCESICPQGIRISEVMADFTGRLNTAD